MLSRWKVRADKYDKQTRVNNWIYIRIHQKKNMWAKPIIDILDEIPVENDISKVKNLIVQNGYICMAEKN
ncbi:MAG: GrpB family protein [Lachnospiraceae bacterium]|nr:GrpB family protein [Lachnospiraceae bacterium]